MLLPTAVAAVYYGLIASDVTSRSRASSCAARSGRSSGLGALLQGGGFARSQDDTYSVHDFMLSRDALAELDKKLGLRAGLLR